jgi:hypothetical protein
LGSLFATMITLILIPSLYLVIDDIRHDIHQKKNNGERLAPKFQIQAKIKANIIESETPKSDLKISFFVLPPI